MTSSQAPDHLPDQLPRRRVAVVTGSDSGMGRAIAVALAREGCDVGVTWHRDEQGAEQTAEEVRAAAARAEVRHLDLTQLPQAACVVDELTDALSDDGRLDVLVNNAGTGTATLLLDMDFATWREVISTDLDGAFCCLQRAARRMVDGGRDSAPGRDGGASRDSAAGRDGGA
ncbi:MAG: SDR family NAD(P)-dependent oxidoreductase, partial [Actinomycetes bacterium]